jgi:hypothetical protein
MLETLYRHINMVRLSASGLAVVAVMMVATGCTGLIDGSSDGLTPAQRAARVKWENEAYPVLRDTCVACHGGSRPMIDFLTGTTATEVHDRVMAYDPPVVNLDAVASSRLLTKGQHDGPALINDQPTALLDWLQAERDAQQAGSGSGSGSAALEVTPFNVQICTGGQPDNANGTCPTNHIDISMIAMAPNVEISFIAQALGSGLYLTDLKLTGGAMGAYIEHPLFVSHPASGDPVPDQIDRYFNLKMNLMPSTNDQIAGGTAAFVNFVATDKISIHFKAVSAYQSGTTGGGPTGCKVVQSFTMNAAGPLNQNCASCHAGANPNATSAMDLTGIGNTGDANMQLTVCNQVRTRINFTTPDQSGFYLAPDPNSATNHQFKFPAGGFTTFKSAVDPWVNAERTAP